MKEVFEIAFSHQNNLVTKRDDNLLRRPLWQNKKKSVNLIYLNIDGMTIVLLLLVTSFLTAPF